MWGDEKKKGVKNDSKVFDQEKWKSEFTTVLNTVGRKEEKTKDG